MERNFLAGSYLTSLTALLILDCTSTTLPECEVNTASDSCDGVPDSGAFINLCGICVEGRTGLPHNSGIDNCGVCMGGNKCVGCDLVPYSKKRRDKCGNCLNEEDENWNNCIRISMLWPSVIDVAVESEVKVILTGAGLSPKEVPDINCQFINKQDQKLSVSKQKVEQDVIELIVILNEDNYGYYYLTCVSTNGQVDTEKNLALQVSNSKLLQVETYEPKTSMIGIPFEATLTMSADVLKSAMCYVLEDPTMEPIFLSASVIANQVKCSSFTPWKAKYYYIGVSYINELVAGTVNFTSGIIAVYSPPPLLQEATLSSDLRKLFIKFNQNVKGPNDCVRIFAKETVNVFGKDANCYILANTIIVKLGENPKLDNKTYITLRGIEDASIFVTGADKKLSSAASGSILLNSVISAPMYRLSLPNKVAPNAIFHLRYTADKGQFLMFKFSVDFNKTAANTQFIKHSERLKLWKSIRELERAANQQKEAKQIVLNSSMMVPNIDYILHITGLNVVGVKGPENIMKICLSDLEQTQMKLDLTAPVTIYPGNDFFAEALVDNCRGKVKYNWSVQVSGGSKIEIPFPNESSLYVPSGILVGGEAYNISCTATKEDGSNSIQESIVVNVELRELVSVISVNKIAIGTGQKLVVDASLSYDPDGSDQNIKIYWCCKEASLGLPCKSPAGNKLLADIYPDNLKNLTLSLPPSSLAVGMYNFTAYIYKDHKNSMTSESVQVVVIPGHPPQLNIKPNKFQKNVDIQKGITLKGRALNLTTGCLVWWSAVSSPGFQPLDIMNELKLGDNIQIEPDDEGKEEIEKELELVLPGPTGNWPGLKSNVNYRFRLSASCGNMSSFVETTITTNAPPDVSPLEVTPLEGNAFQTVFHFQTKAAYDTDWPITYKFGYKVTETSKMVIAVSSSEQLFADIILPIGMEIITILLVCDSKNICARQNGPKVQAVAPTSMVTSDILVVREMFKTMMQTEQFESSLEIISIVLQVIKQQQNDKYALTLQQTSQMVTDVIVSEINRRKSSMKGDPVTMKSNMEFLDIVTDVLKLLPDPTEVLNEILSFRDMVTGMVGKGLMRKKRDIPQAQTFDDNYNKKMLETNLKVSDAAIDLSKDDETVLKNMESLLNDTYKYSTMLCLYLNPRQSINYSLKSVNITSYRVSTDLSSRKLPIPYKLEGYVKLGDFYISYNESCIAIVTFSSDYLFAVKSHSVAPKYQIPIISRVSCVIFINSAIKLSQPVSLLIPVEYESSDVKNNKYLQCLVWKNNAWQSGLCDSDGISQNNKLECTCLEFGYISVFAVDPLTTTPITTTVTTDLSTSTMTSTSITTSSPLLSTKLSSTISSTEETSITAVTETGIRKTSYALFQNVTVSQNLTTLKPKQHGVPLDNGATWNVIFRIEEDYKTVLGSDKHEFEKYLREQILDEVQQMPDEMLEDLFLTPGSIITTLRLVDTDVQAVVTVLPVLTRVLNAGTLKIHGTDGQQLKIPPQNITVVYQPAPKEDILIYAVGTILCVTAVTVVVGILAAVFLRRYNDKQQTLELQNSPHNLVPTYQKFEFEQTMEGTSMSIAQYHTNTLSNLLNATVISHSLATSNNRYLNPEYATKLNKKNPNKNRRDSKLRLTDNNLINFEQPSYQATNSSDTLDNLPGTPTDN